MHAAKLDKYQPYFTITLRALKIRMVKLLTLNDSFTISNLIIFKYTSSISLN
jgi:hypothetical protein